MPQVEQNRFLSDSADEGNVDYGPLGTILNPDSPRLTGKFDLSIDLKVNLAELQTPDGIGRQMLENCIFELTCGHTT